MKRFFLTIGLIVLAIVLLLSGLAGAYVWRFSAHIPAADYPAPANVLEARLQDLDYLRRLPEADYSFTDEELAAFNAHIDAMTQQAEELSEAEFLMGIARAAAITENGHTNVLFGRLVDQLNSLPVRFFWFGDGLYIVRARAERADLLGARVVSYEGLAPEALAAGLDPYFGGTPEFLHFRSPLFLASPASLAGAGLIEPGDSVTLLLETSDGARRSVELDVENTPTRSMRVNAHPLPITSRQEEESGNAWAYLDVPLNDQSFFHRNPEARLWEQDLPGGGHYIRIRAIAGTREISLPDWLASVRERLSAQPAAYLVLDLRSNYGGDFTRAMGFARGITDLVRPDGNVYILTDGGTFSAALVTTAFASHAAGENGFITGSRAGDDEQFWAEGGGVMRLPNSGLGVTVSTGYHDWEHGCKNPLRCYWLSVAVDVPAGSLDPEIHAPLLFEDFRRGVDTTMREVLAREDALPR